MTDLWYRGLHRFCTWVYFARVTVIYPERLPAAGPVLYLGLHRNGAMDGFVYHSLLPRARFLISTQLRRNPLGRVFFCGIEIVRNKDEGDRSVNAAALQECVDHLNGGGGLFVFPEGTSSLGPKHLPFRSGAAQLVLDYLAGCGAPIQVVPIGIHYECPWGFRSKVEVVVGAPVSVSALSAASPIGRLKEVKRRMQAGLESVGVNVESAGYQQTIQRLSYVATLATPRSYFKTLQALEHSIPEKVLAAWQALEPELAKREMLRHQGVPLFPLRPVGRYALALAGLAPVVGAALLLNLPPFLAGGWAGNTFPDDRNVISLWRTLVGIPLVILWTLLLAVLAVALGQLPWFGIHCLVTLAGLKLYYPVKKLAVAVHNGLRHSDLRSPMLAFRELVLEELPDEPSC